MTATAGNVTDPFITKRLTGGALAVVMVSAWLVACCRLSPMFSSVLGCRKWWAAKEKNKTDDIRSTTSFPMDLRELERPQTTRIFFNSFNSIK
jgi:hypothetical protein